MGALLPALALAMLLAGCATPEPSAPAAPPARARPAALAPPAAVARAPFVEAGGEVLARNPRLLLYLPVAGDTWRGIARRFLGDAALDWSIADANALAEPAAGHATGAAATGHGLGAPAPGVTLAVPLAPRNRVGVWSDRYQTVPILCYHRFGNTAAKMTVTPRAFAEQLEHLARNGYRVIPLAELRGFLDARRALPPRTVAITIDDGYESVHRHAFPLLKKYGFPATLFVYTDFIGAPDAVSWPQLQEMQRSGLVDVQSHSKTHRNLIERGAQESELRYREAIDAEMRVPRDLLGRRVDGAQVQHIAWPYGDANSTVLDSATRHGFELGATVIPGGNPFFAQPLMLRRTMIFGDMELDAFKARLQTVRAWSAP